MCAVATPIDEWKKMQDKEAPESSNNRGGNTEEHDASNEILVQVLNDEEVALIANGMREVPGFLDDVVNLYMKHERIFMICLAIQIILEIFFHGLSLFFSEETIHEMQLIYGGIAQKQADKLYWILFSRISSNPARLSD
jgi:hypothetical protein